ncbi:MAG: GHKL domain-containing protein, partial [Candidatus Eisenbacteria sp.]|nr:GHKL domain-containing protein [Candidatus Eisenbacteria bacterium]
GSPNNLRGDLVNATSDDRARLFAISATGQLLWSQAFGVHYYSLRFAVGDLDGDGTQEIAVATRHHSAGPYADSLAVLDAASGRKLAMIPTPATCNGIAIGRSHADGGAYVYLATSTGTITRFRFRDRSLKQDIVARSSSSVSLVGVADILPMPGDEVIASVGKQGIVLDGELQILAQFENPIRDPGSFLLCHVWRQDPHPALLVISNGTRRMAVWFRPFPKELPSGILMAAVGLALAAALGFGIRRYQRSARNGSIPRTRDILVRILQGLEESSHGSLSTMKSLKHLENRLGYAGEDEALHGRFREQIEHNYGDFIESCYPRLIEILDQAAQAGLDPALIRATRAALEATRERLLKLAATGFAFAEIPGNLSEIKQYNAQIDEGFAAIRKAVVSRFATDVVAMLKRMLKLAEADLTQSGVAIRFAGGEIAGEMICLIAAQDLRFILENLIDNARKAMAEAPRRELTVGVQREDKLGVIRITDTGRGMAPQDQVAIFTRGQTAKGGGLGLYRSREILKPWRGELLLEASEPGRGSSFALRLHLV